MRTRISMAPFALFAAVTVGTVVLFGPAAGADPKPNVVFIIADDLGYRELGSFGQKLIRTPNLDELARQGMRFTQHYSGNAVCAPSRCVLMTGKHPGHAYIRTNRSPGRERRLRTASPSDHGAHPHC